MRFLVLVALVAASAALPPALADAAPPLQQLRDGVDPRDVECRGGMELVVRPPSDPACVRQSSVGTMEERGWVHVQRPDGGPDPAPAPAVIPGDLVSGAYSPGPYAVGVQPNFVYDEGRPFDEWGSKYKSDEYQELLARITASGQPSTVVTNVYYPSPPSGSPVERPAAFHPSPLQAAAAGGDRHTVLDLHMGNAELAAGNQVAKDPSHEYQSFVGAPLAAGAFPLVVMIHGLGGDLLTWNQAAEHLASHGYVVATLAYTSDSTRTPVFEDPGAPFASASTRDEVDAAYALRSQETGPRVFANFLGMMYGFEGEVGPGMMPDPSELTARPGGGLEAGRMMADLFEQRTNDLGSVIREMSVLAGPGPECSEALGGDDLCGFFEGSVDMENVGVMGHSLGSMTTQSALAFLPEVDTAVAFNNGMPSRWEPFGGFPDSSGDPGMPDGVPRDIMFVIGSDDYFVHTVFREIHMRWFEMAGGDVSETYPLEIERAWPTADDPQPVARAAYDRALGAKALVTFRDQGHGDATDDVMGADRPGFMSEGARVPLEPGAPPEKYQALGWVSDDGGDVFLPHQMRNYLVKAWFDWQLKGDDSQRGAILDHPFEIGITRILSEGVAP